MLSEEVKAKKQQLAEKMKLFEPKFHEYVENAEFPQFVIDSFQEIKLGQPFTPKTMGGYGSSVFEKNSIYWEACRSDTSIGTFLGVHFGLGIATIEACGDDE